MASRRKRTGVKAASEAVSTQRVTMNEKQESPYPSQSSQRPPSAAHPLSWLPSSWVPYAELMRLEKPAGFYAFYVPYLIGLGYGACLADQVIPPVELLSMSGWLLVYCIILRGAACAWNDNMDQDFDRQVARTKMRPIARGAVSTTQAHLFTAALLVAQIPILMALPAACAYHAVPINILFGCYALMKRVTNYPQFVLGFPFAWGIILSCAALDVDPLQNDRIIPTGCLLAANVVWTMIYDTIYAHQDIRDDVKAGVKSMAVRFADSTKTLAAILAVFQVTLLACTGWLGKLSPVYYSLTSGATAVALGSMIAVVDLKEPSSCAWFFHSGFWYVGGSIILGFAAEYSIRVYDLDLTLGEVLSQLRSRGIVT